MPILQEIDLNGQDAHPTRSFSFKKGALTMKFSRNSFTSQWLPILLPLLAVPTAFIGFTGASASLRGLEGQPDADAMPEQELTAQIEPAAPVTLPRLPVDRPTVGQVPFSDSRQVRRAERDLQRARERAFSVQFLAQQTTASEAEEVTTIAQSILERAESNYQAGQFFEAEKEAKAARAIYEAAENLYESELGYVISSSGRLRGPSRSYFDAPYRAQERIARAEAELSFYQQNDPQVSELMNRARALAEAPGSVTPVQNPAATDLAYLARNRAAYQLAKGAVHLMEAARGF